MPKSTNFVAEITNYLGRDSASLSAVPKAQVESPSDYVRRIIAEKGLSHVKVAQRAKALGGELSPGYVNSIIQGHVKSPSVDMIKNLALGLGEPEDDVFDVFRGMSRAEDASLRRGFWASLANEAEQLGSETDKREIRVMAEALKREIQRRTLKS